MNSDTVFLPKQHQAAFQGEADRLCRLIQELQLKDEALWPILERQFADRPDVADKGWRGEFWGKLMRGGVVTYQYTRDEALYTILEESVRRMLRLQDDRGVFSTYTPELELCGWDMWCRKYILLGMEYFLEICKDSTLSQAIIDALCRHLDAIMEKVGPGKLDITLTSHRWEGLNACSILEPVVWLYRLTNQQKYLDFAAYIVSTGGIVSDNLIELSLQGQAPYQFPVTKAYEMMSFFEGVLEYYRVTGEERYRTAVENLAKSILVTDVTVIGSCGCHSEQFDNSAKTQTNAENKMIMQETCVTVTWMKVCWQLYRLTGEKVWLDQIERSAVNGLYGSINTDGREENFGLPFDSYSPLIQLPRGRKTGGKKSIDGDRIYGCCAAIGAMGMGLVPLAAVTADKEGLRLGFYFPGTVQTVTPQGHPVTLQMEKTETTDAQKVKIRISCEEENFTLRLRKPDWAGTVTLDRQAEEENGWLVLGGAWKDDTIEVTLTTPLMIQRQDGFAALRHGPHMLARDVRCGEDLSAPMAISQDAVLTETTAPFPTEKAFKLGDVTLCDYASCGKTWNAESITSVWLKEK